MRCQLLGLILFGQLSHMVGVLAQQKFLDFGGAGIEFFGVSKGSFAYSKFDVSGLHFGLYSRRSCWVGLWVSLRSDWFQGREESVWQKVFQTWRTGSVVFIWFLRRWDAWLLGTMVKANACSMEVMKVVLQPFGVFCFWLLWRMVVFVLSSVCMVSMAEFVSSSLKMFVAFFGCLVCLF